MDWGQIYDEGKSIVASEESLVDQLLLVSQEDRYTDLDLLDEGSMKLIHTCTDLATGRQVAYAIPKSNEKDFVENFIREAKLTSSLQHPNIVPVYDLGLKEENPFFTMKLIDGVPLNKILKKSYFAQRDLLELFVKILNAVAYAHSRGIIHLDLKPSNILVNLQGDLWIMDWGLSRVVDLDKMWRF